jgi:hypothetical protein
MTLHVAEAVLNDGAGPYYVQDARARLTLGVDWSAWLTQESTTITSSVWVGETGIVLDGGSHTPNKATVYVSGGLTGNTYTVRNTITTASGLTDSRSLRVVIRDR